MSRTEHSSLKILFYTHDSSAERVARFFPINLYSTVRDWCAALPLGVPCPTFLSKLNNKQSSVSMQYRFISINLCFGRSEPVIHNLHTILYYTTSVF